MFKAKIPKAFNVEDSHGKQYTLYEIEIAGKRNVSWTVKKRYSDFDALDKKLRAKFQRKTDHLPPLPPKKWIGNLDANFIETRRQQLENYLVALLNDIETFDSEEIQAFLDMQKHMRRMLSKISAADDSSSNINNYDSDDDHHR